MFKFDYSIPIFEFVQKEWVKKMNKNYVEGWILCTQTEKGN